MCTIKYGRAETDTVVWIILKDNESINIPMGPLPIGSVLKKDVDATTSLAQNFLDLLWPSIAGKSKVIDSMTSDPRHPYHRC